MKTTDILKKINSHTLDVPVYLEDINDASSRREARGWDFGNYWFEEKDRTVHHIDIHPDRVTIYYK